MGVLRLVPWSGTIAPPPTEPYQIVRGDGISLVDVTTRELHARTFAVQNAESAAFAGSEHVVAMMYGALYLLRITEHDLVDVGRVSASGHRLVGSVRDGTVIITRNDKLGTTTIGTFARAGDRLYETESLDTERPNAYLELSADGVIVEHGADLFEIEGLDRIAAPPSPVGNAFRLVEVPGCPPHPNRQSMIDALSGGTPRPSTSPDRWAIRTAEGLGIGLARESSTKPYRFQVIVGRSAREVVPTIECERARYGIRADGRAALVVVEGSGTLQEIEIPSGRAHPILTADKMTSAIYAPGGVLLVHEGHVGFHSRSMGMLGPAVWKRPCSDQVRLHTVHDDRVLLAHHGRDHDALHVYALTPRGPVALGATKVNVLVAWEDDGVVYFLDHWDITRSRRFALTGLPAAAARVPPDAPIVKRLADPEELAHLPLRRSA